MQRLHEEGFTLLQHREDRVQGEGVFHGISDVFRRVVAGTPEKPALTGVSREQI